MPLSRFTHTLPLDFAAAISGLEAVPPVGAAFFDVLAADEPVAGAVIGDEAELLAGAAIEFGVALLLEVDADFRLLVFAAVASDPLLAGSEVAIGAASALADFLLLLLFFAVVVSEVPDAAAGAVESVEVSVPADFLLLLFFVVPVSAEPDALAGALESAEASVLDDFLLLLLFLEVAVSDAPAVLPLAAV